MVFGVLALIVGSAAGVVALYFFIKKSKKRHWSQGYIMLDGTPMKKEEKPQESNSMFPPGW